MEFRYTADQLEFQRHVRAFIGENMTPELETGISHLLGAGEDDDEFVGRLEAARTEFRKRLDEAGLLRVAWPEEFGGEGRSPMYQYILAQELEIRGLEPWIGIGLAGAVIQRFGTEEQKETFLPGLLSREIRTCAGFTEPRGGTDLAALETRAVRDGDDWIINGQKIYTTSAHRADYIWLLARTDRDAPKHEGISIFMVDIKSPGIVVRPLWTMGTYRTNEVFLDAVRVPHRCLIGEENKGWYQNTVALNLERVNAGSHAPFQRFFDAVVDHCKEEGPDGRRLADDPLVRLRLGELAVDLEMLRHLAEKNAWMISEGQIPSMEAAMAKIWSTELYYRITSTLMQLMGPFGQLQKASKWARLDGEVEAGYRNVPPGTFGGGANEVQRDVIARRGLGLPRSR